MWRCKESLQRLSLRNVDIQLTKNVIAAYGRDLIRHG